MLELNKGKVYRKNMSNGIVWIPLLPLQRASSFVPFLEKLRDVVEINVREWAVREDAAFPLRHGAISSVLPRLPEEARGAVLNNKL